jgi:hypothetical protein
MACRALITSTPLVNAISRRLIKYIRHIAWEFRDNSFGEVLEKCGNSYLVESGFVSLSICASEHDTDTSGFARDLTSFFKDSTLWNE